MAKHFYSYQFDMPYRPTYLRNWEVPKYYCPKPRRRLGTTQIISNSRGHLLPGVPRPPCNPFGDFVGTWVMPGKITREVANKLNGTTDKRAFLEKCRMIASSPPKTKYHKVTKEERARVKNEEDEKLRRGLEEPGKVDEAIEDSKVEPEFKDRERLEERVICPIHDF